MENIRFIFIYVIMMYMSCTPAPKRTGNSIESNIKYLTNDSIKYWETYSNAVHPQCIGLFFGADGTCDEYNVDLEGKRQFNFYGDIVMDKPLAYNLHKDSLFVFYHGCKLERCKYLKFNIVKLTSGRLDVILNLDGKSYARTYFASKDQHTKPKY